MLLLVCKLNSQSKIYDQQSEMCCQLSFANINILFKRHLNKLNMKARKEWMWIDQPMVTSEELCVSRNWLRWCQTRGNQSTTRARSESRAPTPHSVSTRRRIRNRPSSPFTGSMWLAHSTHRKLWCSCRFVVEHVA